MSIDLNLLKKLNQRTLGKDVNTLRSDIQESQDKIDSLIGDKFYYTESVEASKIVKGFVEKFYASANVDYDQILKDVDTKLRDSIENQDVIDEYNILADEAFNVGRATRDSLLKSSGEKSEFNFREIYVENLFNSNKINSKTKISAINTIYENYFETKIKETFSNVKSNQYDINLYDKLKKDWFNKDDDGNYYRVVKLLDKINIFETETKSEKFDRLIKLENEKNRYYSDNEMAISEFKNGFLENTSGLVLFSENKLKNLELSIKSLENEIQVKGEEIKLIESSIQVYDINKKIVIDSIGKDADIIKILDLNSIIKASEAHKESLKVYGGERINKLILAEAAKGKFSLTASELTDIEALLLLESGYELTKSTNRVNRNNKLTNIDVWVISWGNSPNIPTQDKE